MPENHYPEEVACMSGAPIEIPAPPAPQPDLHLVGQLEKPPRWRLTRRGRYAALYAGLIMLGFTVGLLWPFVPVPA